MGAPRQGSTRLTFLLLALVLIGVSAGLFALDTLRARTSARTTRVAEVRDLDARFERETDRFEAGLRELPAAPKRASVLSASTWIKSPDGFVRTAGAEPKGIWEESLYRVLPAEIAKHRERAILPISGPAAEIVRLGLFPDANGSVAAVVFRPQAFFADAPAEAGTRSSLVEASGLVVADTNPAQVGKRREALTAALVRESAADPRGERRLASKSWEGFASTLKFRRIEGWNAFLVVERVHAASSAAARNPLVLWATVAGGLFGFLFLGLAFVSPPFRSSESPNAGRLEPWTPPRKTETGRSSGRTPNVPAPLWTRPGPSTTTRSTNPTLR